MGDYKALVQEIEGLLKTSVIESDLGHSRKALEWLVELDPNADELMKISALAHDIERSVTGITEGSLKDYSQIDEFKKQHAIRSANITVEIMGKYRYTPREQEEVRRLIEAHEVGGDDKQTVLKDADSLAYFSFNVGYYLKKYGAERTKKKIEFMYNRLTDRAKGVVNNMKFDQEEVAQLFKEALR